MHMRRFTLLSFFLIAIMLASLGFIRSVAAQDDDGGSEVRVGSFQTELLGENEVVDGKPGAGDLDGFGFATVTLIESEGLVCYSLTAVDIEPATSAHIHVAPAGESGPVVLPLNPPTNGGTGGCIEADPDLIGAILDNPENYYVNVHNAPFPGGALRGQLGV